MVQFFPIPSKAEAFNGYKDVLQHSNFVTKTYLLAITTLLFPVKICNSFIVEPSKGNS